MNLQSIINNSSILWQLTAQLKISQAENSAGLALKFYVLLLLITILKKNCP